MSITETGVSYCHKSLYKPLLVLGVPGFMFGFELAFSLIFGLFISVFFIIGILVIHIITAILYSKDPFMFKILLEALQYPNKSDLIKSKKKAKR